MTWETSSTATVRMMLLHFANMMWVQQEKLVDLRGGACWDMPVQFQQCAKASCTNMNIWFRESQMLSTMLSSRMWKQKTWWRGKTVLVVFLAPCHVSWSCSVRLFVNVRPRSLHAKPTDTDISVIGVLVFRSVAVCLQGTVCFTGHRKRKRLKTYLKLQACSRFNGCVWTFFLGQQQ